MSPQVMSLAVFSVKQLIAAAPELVTEFENIFSGTPPTDADFDALQQKVAGESYAQFVPESAIGALTTAATVAHPPADTSGAPTGTTASGS